ncbi:MAG: ATP-binding protein [Candidatus Hecatellales archaeon]|nr:MAG: ATP-binding protein [Candidatus Hecatellales archaeon]
MAEREKLEEAQRKMLETYRKEQERIDASMRKIKHKILVMSGKGGVGKSTVTVNLAIALAKRRGNGKIGILDADITGPSIPKMLGIRSEKLSTGPAGVFPAIGPLGIRVVSMDFLLPSDETPVIWRGPLKATAIRQFLGEVVWGELDYLLIDLPPGTGDEALTVIQSIPKVDGAIIVTIPSEVSELVVKKALGFAKRLGVPILGIVENMAGFLCPNCGAIHEVLRSGAGERMAKEAGVKLLGKIPLDPRVSESSDLGVPLVDRYPDSPVAKIFEEIVLEVERQLGEA